MSEKKNNAGILAEPTSESRMVICRHCHKEFSPRIPTQVFCSRRCRERDKEKRHDKRRTARGVKIVIGEIRSRICPICGNSFEYRFFGGSEKVYCSKKCAEISSNRKRYNKLLTESGKKPLCHHVHQTGTFVQKTEQELENIRIGKFLLKEKLKEIREENGKTRTKYYQDHPEEYASLVDTKNKLKNERRDRHYAMLRNVSKRKARENLRKRVVTAKKYGIKTGFAVCECCGDTFEYVAEQYRIDSNKNVIKRFPVRRIPRFCCETCQQWHNWNNGKRERYSEYRKLKEKENEKKSNVVTRWRGQYGNWYFNNEVNDIEVECDTVNSNDRDDVVDLSQSLSTDMLASIDEL